jgi:hypothetical protein
LCHFVAAIRFRHESISFAFFSARALHSFDGQPIMKLTIQKRSRDRVTDLGTIEVDGSQTLEDLQKKFYSEIRTLPWIYDYSNADLIFRCAVFLSCRQGQHGAAAFHYSLAGRGTSPEEYRARQAVELVRPEGRRFVVLLLSLISICDADLFFVHATQRC